MNRFLVKVPRVAAPYLEAIGEIRRRRGKSILRSAAAIGVHRDTWSNLERDLVDRPMFDHVAAMASEIGMRLMLVPDTGMERRPVRLPTDLEPDPEVEPERILRWRRASPTLCRLMDKIKGGRVSAGLTHTQAAARASWNKSTWGNLERGHHNGREVGVDRVASAAQAVNMRLEVVAEHHEPLLELDADEAEWLIRLAEWYRGRSPKMPVIGTSTCDKLIRATRRAEKAA